MTEAATNRGKNTAARSDRNDRLSLDDIVRAATTITEESGLDGLTMRRLADALGVTSMAPYYYVRNKDELVDLVTDAVMATVRVPDASSGTWDERLWKLNRDSRRAIARHPGLGDVLMSGRQTEAGRRLTEATIDLLREAGFGEAEALLAYNTFNALMFGRLVVGQRDGPRGGEERFYRWAFDTLIAGFKSRLDTTDD